MARELAQSSRKRLFPPIGFALKVYAIAANTFLESVRQFRLFPVAFAFGRLGEVPGGDRD